MLARSRKDGEVFECPIPVRDRYAVGNRKARVEIWTLAHQTPRIRAGKTLRIITSSPFAVRWSSDGNFQEADAKEGGLGCWYADLPTVQLPAAAKVNFTIRQADRGEERNFMVEITGG